MKSKLITVLLLIVAVIQTLPVIGVLGIETLTSLYQLDFEDRDLEILMRHRAILFGLLGLSIAYAAFHRRYHPAALLIGFIMGGSFLALAYAIGQYNDELRTVVSADIVSTIAVVAASALYRSDTAERTDRE